MISLQNIQLNDKEIVFNFYRTAVAQLSILTGSTEKYFSVT